MSRPPRKPDAVGVPAPIATHKVRFGKPQPGVRCAEGRPVARVPRVARLLALAHRIDGMIRSGELKDWAEAARLIGVTRARMTQIANLMLLSPHLQERLLDSANESILTEHQFRTCPLSILWVK